MAANAGFWNAGSGNLDVEGSGGVALSSCLYSSQEKSATPNSDKFSCHF